MFQFFCCCFHFFFKYLLLNILFPILKVNVTISEGTQELVQRLVSLYLYPIADFPKYVAFCQGIILPVIFLKVLLWS